MKSLVVAAVAAFAFSTLSAQAGDLFAVVYGNTFTSVAPDGSREVTYINADKTWEQHEANGSVVKGTYAWKDDTHACFTVTDPVPADPSKTTACDEIKGEHKVGDSWSETRPDGKTYTLSITAGR